MDISSLTGFRLEACRFSRSSYTFEFDGRLDGIIRRFAVSTAYCVSLVDGEMKDAREKFSLEIWPLIEVELKSVLVEDNAKLTKVTFLFDDRGGFVVWASKPLTDNLLLVKDVDSGDWFPVM